MALTINVDGASRGNPGPAASAAVFRRDGRIIKRSSAVIGHETNNTAEYRALLGALRYLPRIREVGEPVMILSDSKLVVEQVNGVWGCNHPALIPLWREAQQLLEAARTDGRVALQWIAREMNRDADALCNKALDEAAQNDQQQQKGA